MLVGLPQAQIHLLFPAASKADFQHTVYLYQPASQVTLDSKEELYVEQLFSEEDLGEFVFCLGSNPVPRERRAWI